jgi:[acyl-carrier-protein] S-malonyltransferase
MERGAKRLAAALDRVEVRTPSVPVVSNVTAKPTTDPAEIRRNLVLQVTHPVRFSECVLAAKSLGATETLETAPGRVLSGLVRRIDETLKTRSADTAEAVRALVAAGAAAGGQP